MEILVTNDDGIFADGLRILAKHLKKIGHVTVVAPDRQRSATGHAITVHHPLRVEEVKLADVEVPAYAVNGTPSDCVKLAVEALLTSPPEVVVSGINPEPNLGTDVLYSGTVSAALEGMMAGIPSLAVSLANEETGDFDYAAEFTVRLIQRLREEGGLPPDLLLNINIPSLEPSAIVGVKLTKLGVRRYQKCFDQRVDPRGKVYFWLAGEVFDTDEDPETDTVALRNNYISVTPLHFDLTRYDLLDRLKAVDFSALK